MKRLFTLLAVATCMTILQAFAQTQVAAPDHASNQQHIVVLHGTLWQSFYFPERASGYFTIRNDDGADQLLQGITSPVCHEIAARHSNQETTQATENLFSHLALPHDSKMIFPPSGYHLLCSGITQMPAVGSRVPFTFSFMGGDSVTVSFEVTSPDAPPRSEPNPQ